MSQHTPHRLRMCRPVSMRLNYRNGISTIKRGMVFRSHLRAEHYAMLGFVAYRAVKQIRIMQIFVYLANIDNIRTNNDICTNNTNNP